MLQPFSQSFLQSVALYDDPKVIGFPVHTVVFLSTMSSSATPPRNPLQTTDPYARGHQIFPTLASEQIARAIHLVVLKH